MSYVNNKRSGKHPKLFCGVFILLSNTASESQSSILCMSSAHNGPAQTIHPSPAVRKHFNGYLLPNELVSVSHPEAKSLAQATQSAGAVAPGYREIQRQLHYN